MHSTKSASPISLAFPSALKALFLASRPKTWSASLCPVLIGGSMSSLHNPLSKGIFLLTLLFALFIQIGTNYANDYFDFIKGADNSQRVGPKRAVQQGWIAPRMMLYATAAAFATAFLIAIPLMISAGWWSWGLASLCVLFGILYTGGPKPLGYAGLGELLVFIFFGPVAAMGSYFLQTGTLDSSIFIASLAPGFLSAAILMANNLRDEKTDAAAGKRTLAVRFGTPFGRRLYVAFFALTLAVPLLLIGQGFSLMLAASSAVCLFAPIRKVFGSIEVLQETSLLLLVYTILFSSALLW